MKRFRNRRVRDFRHVVKGNHNRSNWLPSGAGFTGNGMKRFLETSLWGSLPTHAGQKGGRVQMETVVFGWGSR